MCGILLIPGKDATEVRESDISYIVDPRAEDSGSTGPHPRRTIMQVFDDIKGLCNSVNWKGITGNDHVPASGEWQQLLTKRAGGGFMYYGPSR